MENVQSAGIKLRLFTKFDAVLIIILITLSFSISYLSFSGQSKAQNVEIKLSNKIVKRIPLSKNGRYEVNGSLGISRFEILNGKVRMTESACPNKTCIAQGWIKIPKTSIICLPNKVIITPTTNGEARVDSIAR